MHNHYTITEIFVQATETYKVLGGLSINERKNCLMCLQKILLDNQQSVIEAINSDFGYRSAHETMMAEIITSMAMIDHAINNLKQWSKPRACPIPLMYQPASAKIYPQEKGVVGIICPWNYPVQLVISPLVCAISAGNRVILKLSEKAPATANLLFKLLNDDRLQNVIWLVSGNSDVAAQFSRLDFDHLFFTGSIENGKKVMLAAADNLTPVTLELGGKSPAIIAKESVSKQSVERILNGKLFNAGQTCVAPDIVWVAETELEKFIDCYQTVLAKFYQNSEDNKAVTSIIDQQNIDRLTTMVYQAETANCRIVKPEFDWSPGHPRCFQPLLIINPDDTLNVVKQEVFGPILVLKTYSDYEQIVTYHKNKPVPLTVYLFSNDKKLINKFVTEIRCGSFAVNETLIQAAIPTIPLGGLGASGLGQYHGKSGFDTFSHLKPVFVRKQPNFSRYFQPPYKKVADSIIRFLVRKFSS